MSESVTVLIHNTTLPGGPLKAGTVLDDILEPEVIKHLVKNGHAEKVLRKTERKEEVPGFIGEDGEFVALSSLKVDELKQFAKDAEIQGFDQMKKAELIKAIASSIGEDEDE